MVEALTVPRIKPGIDWLVQRPEPHEWSVNSQSYKIFGQRYRRVTAVLGVVNKPAIGPWMAKQAIGSIRETMLNAEVRSELREVLRVEDTPALAYVRETLLRPDVREEVLRLLRMEELEYVVTEYPDFIDRMLNEALDTPVQAESTGTAADDRQDDDSAYRGFLNRMLEKARKAPTKAKDDAADWGTDVHSWAEEVLYQGEDPSGGFLAKHGLTLVEVECLLWDDILGIAGTTDTVAEDEDLRLVIVDWKSGRGIYPEYGLQVCAYTSMLRDQTGRDVADPYVVRLTDDSYVYERVEDWEYCWETYKAAHRLQDGLTTVFRKK